MDNLNEKILIEAGLSEEQAMVYSSLLEKGPMKAGPISSWTGIKRGLVYKVLEQLQNLGLVSKNENMGAVAVFSPSHPERLREIMEQKEKAFSLAKETVILSLGSLSSKFNLLSGKPNVQFFEGLEGVERVLDDTLKSEEEVLTYADVQVVDKYFKDINDRYLIKREKMGLKKRVLVIENEYSREFFNQKLKENPDYFSVSDVKMVKTPFNEVEGAIEIYGNKIGIITISKENLISIIIEDERISNMFKSLFEAIYLVSDVFKS